MLVKQRKDNDHLNDLINEFLKGKQNLIGVEIGSYQGESTELFLESGAFKTLYCIDPWLPGYDTNDLAAGKDIVLAEQEFDKRFKNSNIIVKIKLKSSTAIKLFSDGLLDFIYIDGCHTYSAVKEDLNNYFSKVKKGGIIAGHDYPWKGVAQAVDEFFKKKPLKTFADGSWLHIKE